MTLTWLDIVARLFVQNLASIPIHSSNNLAFSHIYQSRNVFWNIKDKATRFRHCLMEHDVMSMITYP